jgi:integrase
MPRGDKRGPKGHTWYWARRDRWAYTPTGGRGPVVIADHAGNPVRGRANKAAAYAAWRLTAAVADPRGGGRDFPLRALVLLFLADRERRGVAAVTLKYYRRVLASLLTHVGDTPAPSLIPRRVELWWDRAGWGPSTRATAGRVLMTMLTWGAAPGGGGKLIPENPVRGMPIPTMRVRSAGVVVTDEEYRHVLAGVKCPCLRDALTVLRETGMRPVDLSRATAAHLAPDGLSLVYSERTTAPGQTVHKSYRKTGREAVYVLPPPAAEVVARLASLHPAGPLFYGPKGRPWSATMLSKAVGRAGKRAGLGGRFVGYSLRHTLGTRIVTAGGTLEMAAAVLNNTPAVVARNYNHARSDVGAKLAVLRSLGGAV